MEKWKKIIGYEELYEVSNSGRVRSIKRDIILSQCKVSHGYLAVGLSKDGSKKTYTIHRLVAMHFLCDKDYCVNHKDGNKKHNNVSNLEWCNMKYNNLHAIKTGLRKASKGINNPKCKLTIKDIVGIKTMHSTKKFTQIEIAKKYNVSRVTIYRIINNLRFDDE